MKAKFDQDYVIYDRNYVRSVCQTTSKDEVWQQDDLVITSIDFAKQDDMLEALENTEWDICGLRRGSPSDCTKGERRDAQQNGPIQRWRGRFTEH